LPRHWNWAASGDVSVAHGLLSSRGGSVFWWCPLDALWDVHPHFLLSSRSLHIVGYTIGFFGIHHHGFFGETYLMWQRLFQSARVKARRHRAQRTRLALEGLEARQVPTATFLAVGAGDATSSDAILWTRAQDDSSSAGVGLMAQVSADPT